MNTALKETIEYWSDINSFYIKVFTTHKELILFVDVFLVENKQISNKIIIDFVNGLAGSGFTNAKDKSNELMKPLLSSFLEYIKSDDLQNAIIKDYVKGDEVMAYNGLQFHLTTEKLINFRKDHADLIINREDIDILSAKYLSHRKQILDKYAPGVKVKEKEGINQDLADFSFTNNFDNIPEDTIMFFFYQKLVVESKYITVDTFKLFLKNAFEKNIPPKNKLQIICPNERKKVRMVFYKYYTDIAQKPPRKQLEYVKLLGEYFEGFNTESLRTNFSKQY